MEGDSNKGIEPPASKLGDGVLPPGVAGAERSQLWPDYRYRSSRGGHSRRHGKSRRRGKHGENDSVKWIWIGVVAVTVIYVGLLAFRTIVPKLRGRAAAPSAVIVANTIDDADGNGDALTVPLVPGELPRPEGQLPASEWIGSIKSSLNLATEGRRLMRARSFPEAASKFAQAAELAPHSSPVLLDWAAVLRELRRWPEARDVLERALIVAPENTEARLALAQVYVQLRQLDDALAMAEWVIEAEVHNESAHQIAADVHTAFSRHEQAVNHWRKLVAMNSSNYAAENNLGAAYLRLGKPAQALRIFENVLRDQPNNSQAHYYMALCFVDRGEPELAVNVFLQAAERLGRSYVVVWARAPEFTLLQSQPLFQRNFPEAVTP